MAALVATAVLAGCSSGGDDADAAGDDAGAAEVALPDCPVDALDDVDPADGPVQIDLWHTEIGLPGAAIDRIAQEYNASQDRVVVRPQFQGAVPEEMRKFSDAIGDLDSLPAMLSTDETAIQFLADSGVVVPATSCLEADPDAEALLGDLLPAVLSANTIDDVLWPAAPIGLGAVMYQNDAHLRAAGLDPSSPPETLDELRDAAETLRDAGIAGVDAPVVMRVDAWLPEFWTTGAGEAVVDADNGHSGLAAESRYDNPATQEVLDWIDGMVDDGLLKLTDNADLVAAFLALGNGTASVLLDASAAISTVSAVVSGSLTPEQAGLESGGLPGGAPAELEISVSPMPGLGGSGEGQVIGGGWYLVDNGDPAQVAASWDFMKFFLQTDQQVTWAIDSSYLPVQRAAIDSPRLQAYWTDTQPGRWMAVAFDGFASLDPNFPGPIIGPYAEFRLDVIQGIEQLADGAADVDDTIATIDASFGDQLTSYRDDVGA